jgi:hypothetical protein
MKNKIIGILTLSLSSLNISAEDIGSCGNSNSYPQEEQIIEVKPQEQWFQDFYRSTLNDKNPILQLQAIFALNYSESYKNKETLKITFKKILRKPNLNKRSLTLIANICESSDFESICHKQNFTNKHITQDPDNLLNYFPIFASNKDENLNIEKINKQLLKTTYFNIGLGVGSIELKDALQNYQYSHPMPLSEEAYLDEQLSYVPIDKLEQYELIKKLYLENQVENLINMNIISSSFMTIPAFRGLTKYCEIKNTEQACLHMGKLLTSNNTSQISKMIGHSLLLKGYQQLNDMQNYQSTLINKLKFDEQYQCQIEKITPSVFGYLYAEPTYANQYILNLEKLGEVKATQLAQQALDDYFFDNDIQLENSSPVINQKCQDIAVMSDQEFIERFDLEEEFNKELEEFDTE